MYIVYNTISQIQSQAEEVPSVTDMHVRTHIMSFPLWQQLHVRCVFCERESPSWA